MTRAPRSRRSSAGRPRAEVEDFFAGVDEVRAYLDRHLQDPERRRDRLATMARELARPRRAAELLAWLAAQLAEVLGGGGCVVLRRGARWEPWASHGACAAVPGASDLDRMVPGPSGLAAREPVQARHGVLLALVGLEELLGAVWIEHGQDLDPASRAILQAIVDTAGVALEQALAAEQLAHDPDTGLVREAEFVSRIDEARREWGRSALHAGAVGFRLVVDQALARGHGAVNGALRRLADTVRQLAPPGALVGRRFDDVFVLVADADSRALELSLAARARAVAASFVEDASPGREAPATTPAFACSAVYGVLSTGGSVEQLARLERALSQAERGGIHRA